MPRSPSQAMKNSDDSSEGFLLPPNSVDESIPSFVRKGELPRGMALTPGTRLGQYVIRSLVGAGGMGEVYRAHDTQLNREVAIKVLPGSLTADAERLRRFEQEARAAAALNHPNILSVYQMAIEQGVTYLVTELLEGETLRERLAHGAIPLRKAVEYGVQIARGLAAAAVRGIVHRGLKPENLFVTKDGRGEMLH